MSDSFSADLHYPTTVPSRSSQYFDSTRHNTHRHMESSMLSVPTTPPYDHQHHHSDQTQGPAPLLFHPTAKAPMTSHASAFHRVQPSMAAMPSPPELLHDMEDEEDTTSMSSLLSPRGGVIPTHDLPLRKRYSRKSVPHRSPPAIKDPLQASAVDKSVVFQLDVRSHPFFPTPAMASPERSSANHQPRSTGASAGGCPDCGMRACCGLSCTSHIVCGESLLTALRKRVIQARHRHHQSDVALHRRRMVMHHPKRPSRKTTHIEIPRAGSRMHPSRLPSIYNALGKEQSILDNHDEEPAPTPSSPASAVSAEEQHQIDLRRRPWIDDDRAVVDDDDGDDVPQTTDNQDAPEPQPSSTPSATLPRRSVPVLRVNPQPVTSGRPSRAKGPCQACQESSDGCMRKAFDWPFPASSIYNDKGRPFVYLCNKCGLRYNKSNGCVCRHCRWVFCKEEKRKAMQHIEQMRQSRPDGRVDPDEDIENFVCTPKYWTCGRPWKVGWVLQNDTSSDEEDMAD